MQIKPAWKAARNFPIQPLLSSQQCRLPLVIAFPGDYLILACQFSLILCDCLRTCSSFYWLHSWNEFINRASFSLSIWSKNIWKLIFFVKMKRLMLIVSSTCEGVWGLGMPQSCCACEPAWFCVGQLLRGAWVSFLMWELQEPQNIYVIALAVSAKGQFCYENLQPF